LQEGQQHQLSRVCQEGKTYDDAESLLIIAVANELDGFIERETHFVVVVVIKWRAFSLHFRFRK
jgi:hypothetical protein